MRFKCGRGPKVVSEKGGGGVQTQVHTDRHTQIDAAALCSICDQYPYCQQLNLHVTCVPEPSGSYVRCTRSLLTVRLSARPNRSQQRDLLKFLYRP